MAFLWEVTDVSNNLFAPFLYAEVSGDALWFSSEIVPFHGIHSDRTRSFLLEVAEVAESTKRLPSSRLTLQPAPN